MSFGGQTPTIIVLKEGESYPTARCHTKPHTIQAAIRLRRGYSMAAVQPPVWPFYG